MRGEKLERVGREHKLIYYDGSGKHDSITLRGSTWFDHKNQVGGGAIKFMQEFYDMDFQTAVQELLGQTVTSLSHSPPKSTPKEEKKEFSLPEANRNMHRIYTPFSAYILTCQTSNFRCFLQQKKPSLQAHTQPDTCIVRF